MQGVFANPDLRRVQLAYAGSSIGNFAYGVAIAVYAYEHGGATAVGVVTAIRQVIAAVIAPFAASLADRFPRERVMLASDLGRVVTVGVDDAALVTQHSPALAVYVVATMTTILGTVFRPAEAALIPVLARTPEELTAANVSSSTFDSLGVFVGPAIAAFLLASSGTAAALRLHRRSPSRGARTSSPASARRPAPRPREHAARGSNRPRSSAGFNAIAAEPRLRLLIGLYGAQCFVAGALGVFVVVIALQLLGLGTAGVGLLQAACGVGALLGAAVSLSLVARARIAADFAIGLLSGACRSSSSAPHRPRSWPRSRSESSASATRWSTSPR